MAIKKLTNTSNISSPLTGNTGHYWGVCGNSGNISGTTTTTTGSPYWGNTLIASPGQVITTGTNTLSWGDGISMNSDIVEYVDIFYQLMGIDMDYKRFSLMSKEEKRSFIRDIKLQKLIDEK